MPKKFEVTVTHSKTYIVELDTELFAKPMAIYNDAIHDLGTDLEEHAKNIAERVLLDDDPDDIEGYGELRYVNPAGRGFAEYIREPGEPSGITIIQKPYSEEIETEATPL